MLHVDASSLRSHVFAIVTLAVVSVALLSSPARAESEKKPDFASQASALEDAVKEHEKADDTAMLVADVGRAVALYAEAQKAEAQEVAKDMVDLVGSLVRSRTTAVEVAALRGLGQMGDTEGYRYLKPYLRPHDDIIYGEGLRTALEVAGKVRHDRLVLPLIKMVEKSKNFTVAADALMALSHYRDSRLRARVVKDITKTVKKDKPGGWTRSKTTQTGDDVGQKQGSGAGDRWSTLAPKMVEGLNALTGQKFATAGDWFDMVDEYDRNLDVLFVDR